LYIHQEQIASYLQQGLTFRHSSEKPLVRSKELTIEVKPDEILIDNAREAHKKQFSDSQKSKLQLHPTKHRE